MAWSQTFRLTPAAINFLVASSLAGKQWPKVKDRKCRIRKFCFARDLADRSKNCSRFICSFHSNVWNWKELWKSCIWVHPILPKRSVVNTFFSLDTGGNKGTGDSSATIVYELLLLRYCMYVLYAESPLNKPFPAVRSAGCICSVSLFGEGLLQSIRGVILFIAQACKNACSFHRWHCIFSVVRVRHRVTIYSAYCWIMLYANWK